jgi:alpha-1,2-mannosyltransferase
MRRIFGDDVRALLDRFLASPPLRSRVVLATGAILFSAAFLFQTAEYLYVWDTDSPSYYAAARALARGVNPYDPRTFQETADETFGSSLIVLPYLYPPLLAQIFRPLAGLTPSAYFAALQALNWVLTFLALYLTARLLDLRGRRNILPVLLLFALLPGNRPLLANVFNGQINLLVLDAVLAFLLFGRTNKPWPAGFFLSLAILLKVYPALFVLPLLLGRRWKHLAAAAATGAALVVSSFLVSGLWPWREFISFSWKTTVRPPDSAYLFGFENAIGNVSLKGFVHHLFEALGLPRSAVVLAWGVVLGVLVAAVILLVRKKRWSSDLGFQSSVLFLLTVLLAPISWSHHYVVALVPAVYLFGRILRERRYGAIFLWSLFGAMMFYSPVWAGFPFNQTRTAGALFLLLLLLIYDRRTPPAGIPAEATP